LLEGDQSLNMRDMWNKKRHRVAIPPPKMVGGAHAMAMVTDEDVIAMRRRYADGETVAEIASSLGIGRSACYMAISGYNWRHLPGAVRGATCSLERRAKMALRAVFDGLGPDAQQLLLAKINERWRPAATETMKD
jgi:hypothetical protein